MLAGVAGAFVPLVIHLIHRARAPRHLFPAVELLMVGPSPTVPHRRLRDLLVLLMRMSFVALFGTALALPLLELGGAGALSDQPRACVVLLDDTLSMQYRAGTTSLFQQAKERAASVLAGLRSSDRARLILLSGRPVGPTGFTADVAALRNSLEGLNPTYGRYAAGPALKNALASLEAEAVRGKLLVILSGFTRSIWTESDLSLLAGASVRLEIPDLWQGRAPENRFIESVELQREAGGIAAQVTVGMTDQSDRKSFPCALELEGGGRCMANVAVNGSGRGRLTLAAPASGRGWLCGSINLPDDPLMADNAYYVCAPPASRIRALLVDGDPRESAYRCESFYLKLALSAGPAQEIVALRAITHEQLRSADLETCDCVILANVPAGSLLGRERMESFVRGGGGLLILLGDRADPMGYERALGDVLPAVPREVREPGSEEAGAARLAPEDLEHPIFKLLERQWLERFAEAEFRAYWLMEMRRDARAVLRFANGALAVAESSLGSGRVLVMASPLDRDWNDLCVQPVFVPFVHGTLRYLCARLDEAGGRMIRVGDTFRMHLDTPGELLYVLPPGAGRQWQAVRLQGEAGGKELVYADASRPGLYQVATEQREGTAVASFAANVDPAASDLRRLDLDGVRRSLARAAHEPGGRPGQPREALRLWPALLWLALLALMCESVLARR